MFRLLKKRFRDDFVVYKRLHGEKISDSRRFLNLAEKNIPWLEAEVRHIQTRSKVHIFKGESY